MARSSSCGKSNAYNHPDRLSEALRERIFETTGRLGYRRSDPVGRSLERLLFLQRQPRESHECEPMPGDPHIL